MNTIEDIVEFISIHNGITVSQTDQSIFNSFTNQFRKNIGLTTKQAVFVCSKIKKYLKCFNKLNIDIDHILDHKVVRIPIRIIIYEKSILINGDNIYIKYEPNVEFSKIWYSLSTKITYCSSVPYTKSVTLNPENLVLIYESFKNTNYIISDEVTDLYNQILEIKQNKWSYIPHIDYEYGHFVLKNTVVNKPVNSVIDVYNMRIHGITNITSDVKSQINNYDCDLLTKKLLHNYTTQVRLNPETYSYSEIFKSFDTLHQFPMVIILPRIDGESCYDEATQVLTEVTKYCSPHEISVLFRFPNSSPEMINFNKLIAENKLNNKLSSTTKVVMISRSRLPKTLLNTEWKPKSAIVITRYDCGRIGLYLNTIPFIYYYNDSMLLKYNTINEKIHIIDL